MSSLQITANGISSTESNPIGPLTISMAGTFGGATVALEQKINETWSPLLDEDTAISYTAANSYGYNLYGGIQIRFSTTNASGTTNIQVSVTGA